MVLCSTKVPLELAARMAGSGVEEEFLILENYEYTWGMKDGKEVLFKGKDLPFVFGHGRGGGSYYTVGTANGDGTRGTTGAAPWQRRVYGDGSAQGVADSAGTCFECVRKKVDRREVLFCEECLQSVIEEWEALGNGVN